MLLSLIFKVNLPHNIFLQLQHTPIRQLLLHSALIGQNFLCFTSSVGSFNVICSLVVFRDMNIRVMIFGIFFIHSSPRLLSPFSDRKILGLLSG